MIDLLGLPAFFFVAVSLCLCWIGFYRTFFSPLSRIPGPRLAALTRGFILYYDLVKGGRLPWKIKDLHTQYGPIVRIAPDEVHVSDPAYASQHFNTKADKYRPHKNRFGFPEATSETIEPDLHKLRSAALAPVFSKRAVTQLEPLIVEKVEKACQKLVHLRSSDGLRPVNLRHLFACMTTDVLTAYAFPVCFNLLDKDDLCPQWYETIDKGLRSVQYFKHFPILWTLMRSKPISRVLRHVVPGLAFIQSFEDRNKSAVKEVIKHYETATTNGQIQAHMPISSDSKTSTQQGIKPVRTVFDTLLSSDLPPREKSFDRLWQEGSSLVGAGTETVANLLSFILVHLHLAPLTLKKLKQELTEAIPDASVLPPCKDLEALPYLSAVISEGLRMGVSVVDRFLRVLPADTVVSGFLLPKTTVVGMSALVLHFDESFWTQAEDWDPGRFLRSDKSRKDLYSFSRGPRACAGMNLAYAELFLTLAAIVRRFDLELLGTTIRDVEPERDGVVALVRDDSKGVFVLVS